MAESRSTSQEVPVEEPTPATNGANAVGRSQPDKRSRWLKKHEPPKADDSAKEKTEQQRRFEEHLPYGICLSGGGIRSASFSLGVLQRMHRDNMLVGKESARWLSCVSGGSYIGTALTILARGPFRDQQGKKQVETPTPEPPTASLPAYDPRSPEVAFLRDNTKYLTHGWGGLPVMFWRLVLGIFWNLILFSTVILLIAVPVGWLYGWRLGSLRVNPPAGVTAHAPATPSWIYLTALAIAVVGIVTGFVWVAGLWTKALTRKILVVVSLGAIGIAIAWLLVLVVTPAFLEWIRRGFETTTSGAHPTTAGAGSSARTTAAAGGSALVLSALTALFGVRAVRTADSWWNQIPEGDRTKVLNKAWHWILSHRATVLNLLAWALAPLTIAAVAIFGCEIGALFVPGFAPGVGSWLAPVVFGAVLFGVILIWTFADLTAWSLHPFYRERLSNAFVLKRFKADRKAWSPTAVDDNGVRVDACPRPYDAIYRLSEAQPDDTPELVVCASANVSKYGATPTGAPVASFVFSWSKIGGDVVGNWTATEYEDALKKVPLWERTITAPGAMAMSGAAISPEMGRMTRPALRFLLTMANVRLGVWVPNPNRLDEFRARAGHRVHRIRLRPRFSYLFREMFGIDDPQSMFLYVTDGGHYENMGLVELIRRKCKYIFCVDASGDHQDTFSTLAGALSLARSELGVEVKIDPTVMAPNPVISAARAKRGLPPVVQQTYCRGWIKYPDGELGRLIVIKAGVPADAPYDLAQYYDGHRSFPCDSTLDQLYDADRFDAYRTLGYLCADQALTAYGPDFAAFRARASRGKVPGPPAAPPPQPPPEGDGAAHPVGTAPVR
jgi:hypothetical protein